ncbi:MAG: hypothetical protein GEV07_04660 [Streptosporangiales bacterium]|nr:hypothetical protein [Streptosporangiales bacterium]
MTTGNVDFTGVKMTLLATLYARAVESREPRPILGDRIAAEILDKVDYDFTKVRKAAGDRYTVAIRAKQLDVWTTEFLAEHPDATVVQLACGLDSRAFRLDLLPAVRWFDLDFPDVVELRWQVYPSRANYQLLGGVRDRRRMARRRAGRPAHTDHRRGPADVPARGRRPAAAAAGHRPLPDRRAPVRRRSALARPAGPYPALGAARPARGRALATARPVRRGGQHRRLAVRRRHTHPRLPADVPRTAGDLPAARHTPPRALQLLTAGAVVSRPPARSRPVGCRTFVGG